MKVMAERLEKTEIVRRPYDISLQEFEDLRTMFRTYADAGCCLVGWW
ncbi:hypothetical protein [Bradyrhizobium sp. 2S1]|nr:hypothetical protein [Bradyrhizobium sp. 2S1]MCK7671464.1 hypothetical protein [Bradyrhizobium sp. 2S1]